MHSYMKEPTKWLRHYDDTFAFCISQAYTQKKKQWHLTKIRDDCLMEFNEQSIFKNMTANSILLLDGNKYNRKSKSVYEAYSEIIAQCGSSTYVDVLTYLFDMFSKWEPEFIMCFGVGEKQNNRNESREVIIGNQLVRILHDIFNVVAKKLAFPI